MDFKPKTEKEIAESRLLAKGIYDFEIPDACDKTSKTSGKPMIELKIRILAPDGSARFITDYLLEQRAGKLLHAATACGLLDKYNSGSLSSDDFRHKHGRLKLGIEKDKSKTYPDKNVVLDYIIAAPSQTEGEIGYGAFTQQPGQD